mgnify:FL=1
MLPDNDGLERTDGSVDAVGTGCSIEDVVGNIIQNYPSLSGVRVNTTTPDEWQAGSPVRASLGGLSIEVSLDHDISQEEAVGLCLATLAGMVESVFEDFDEDEEDDDGE